jgi:transcription-repair coupling factor (superfamily II helicase)
VEVRIALDFLNESAVNSQSSVATDYEPLTTDKTASLPHNYVTEPHHRIEIYRKLAQANDKPALENLQKELRDRFGPLPPPVELLLAVGELKVLASEKSVTAIEVEEDKLKITRHNDFITFGGKFPRLTKKEAKARLKEIKRLLLAI